MSRLPARRLPSMERTVVVCELTGPADVAVVDALARLQLVARRRGLRCDVRVEGPELIGLLDLLGLRGALGQPVGQAEACEQRPIVEEMVDVDDAAL